MFWLKPEFAEVNGCGKSMTAGYGTTEYVMRTLRGGKTVSFTRSAFPAPKLPLATGFAPPRNCGTAENQHAVFDFAVD